MEKIIYKTNMVFNIDIDKNNSIKINNILNPTDYIFVYTTYDNFMRYNPPCNKCLICSMCIVQKNDKTALVYETDPYLYIKICDNLKDFINSNKLFCLQGVI